MNKDEFLINLKSARISLFPIRFPEIYKYSEQLQKSYWTVEEVKFRVDGDHVKMADSGTLNLLKYIIGFFLTADNKVIDVINEKALPLFTVPEVLSFERQKMANEDIHNATYSKAAAALFSDNFDEISKDFQEDPAILAKLGWVQKWIMRDECTLGEYLLAMSMFEGIGFQGLFCAIFNICAQGKFPGLRFSNELISRDEGVHSNAYLFLYKEYVSEVVSLKVIHGMLKDLVKTEEIFVDAGLKYGVSGMNPDSMKEYVRYVADNYCDRLGIGRIYGAKNPFPVMNKINLVRKTNFFEDRDGNYQRLDAGDEVKYSWEDPEKF